MTLGIQTQIALADAARLRQKLMETNKRLAIIQIMMTQFQKQCDELPSGDPVRQVIETFIGAVRNAANGIVVEGEKPKTEPVIIVPSDMVRQ